MNEDTAKRKAAFWVAVVFVLGAALGGVFGYFYGHRGVVSANNNTPPPSEPERRARRLDQMTHDLGLTDAQRTQMDSLLLKIHGDFQVVRETNAKRFDSDMDQARIKSREEIRALLTPEQMPKFEEFLKKLDEDRKKNPPPGLLPGPPPSR
jgi:Spy/CpxP family protein refolding chaperone